MANGYLMICTLIISIILVIIFFTKRKNNHEETKIFSKMLVVNVFELVVTTTIIVISLVSDSTNIFKILNWIDVILIVSWCSLLFYYVHTISTRDYNKKMIPFILVVNIIFYVLALFLDANIIKEDVTINSCGSLIDLGLFSVLFYNTLTLGTLLFNPKKNNLTKEKYISLYSLIILLFLAVMLRIVIRQINVIPIILTIVDMIMMFTIENPDGKMIEQLTTAKEKAEQANIAKSDFLSNMSHEIRTPLNAIVGFSQSLQEKNLSSDAKDEVTDIITASQNLLEIVNGILDFSKIEANKLEIINKNYDALEMLNEVKTLINSRIGDKPLELHCYFDATIPKALYGDVTRIRQIIINLLTNAVKYTNEGYIEFHVDCVKREEVCRLIISVEDSGIGIKSENIDKLFSKFERLDVEKKTATEGTGLGLAITKKLIELMNGKIVVQSFYGQGSKFTVSIDQLIGDASLLENLPNDKKSLDLKDKKILIVDDNNLNLKVSLALFKGYGVQPDTAASGPECIDKIAKGKDYDIIFLDDMMPKMSGVETLKKLKADPNFHTPTVVLTANAITGMREKYLSDGFDEYLSKPIDKAELTHILQKFFNNSQ